MRVISYFIEQPKISGLEEFGNKVISFLKNAIVRTYPDVKIEEDENHDKQEESPEDKIEDGKTEFFKTFSTQIIIDRNF